MTLQFVTGPGSVDHQATLLDDLATTFNRFPDDQFYYLVPNHVKFESEVQVLTKLADHAGITDGTYAQTGIQVLSLTRLAWFFMKNTPAYQLPRISQAGLNMLVYQAILDHRSELRLFAGEADRPGFISLLTRQLSELKTGQITVGDLAQVAQKVTGNSADLDAKLHDLVLLYDSFETAMRNKYVANTDLLNQLSDFLATADLSHAHFYFDGFSQTQFSAQETALITTLMTRSAEVKVALTVDRPTPSPAQLDPQNLFYQPARTYARLYQLALANKVKILDNQVATTPRVTPALQQLEYFWRDAFNGHAPQASAKLADESAVQVVQIDNRYAELAWVAARIRQLVAQGYRYRDILVLTRHLDKYETILAPIMAAEEIPYFSDVQRSMADHPLVELIDALFDVKRRYYQYADVMRLLKTELLMPQDDEGHPISVRAFRDALFKTENWVLKMGYQGHRWVQDADWPYARLRSDDLGTQTSQDQETASQINGIRRFIKTTLPPFFKALDQAQNGREAAQLLVTFLTQNGVVERLTQWRDAAVEAGQLAVAGQPEQTWNTFCDLLDEYVTILGDRAFVADDFLALLQAGFEGASYAQIPSTLDQVVISESGIIQMNNRKITFMIGSTDKVMPDTSVVSALLSDQDREKLTFPEGEYLGDDGVVQLQGEPFVNYLAFMTPQERLYFTFPMNEEGEAVNQLSPYVARIVAHFKLTIQTAHAIPDATDHDISPYLGARRAMLRHLVQASDDSRERNVKLAKPWLYIYQRLVGDSSYRLLTEKLLGSLTYRNVPTPLAPEIVTGLYGHTINSSISKLEEFYQNQYAYFLKYGLKLRERDVFELSAANTGEFFHASLDQLMKQVNAENIDLAKLDDQQLDELVDSVTGRILKDPANLQYAILESSARMAYIKSQLIALIRQTTRVMSQQGHYTPMRAKRTEVMFGQIGAEKGLPALAFDLPNDNRVSVRGKIDRIDVLRLPDAEYLGVVDYKSSEHKVDLNDVYHGIAMQMMTYLDAVQQNIDLLADTETAQLAGALYLHLQNPKFKPSDLRQTDFLSALLKKDRYQGLLVNDDNLFSRLEPQLDKGSAVVYPFRKNANGSIGKAETIVTPSQLQSLLRFTEEKIKAAATAIFAGQLDLNPIKRPDGRTAMQFSPYKAIMQFDPMLTENNYRLISKIDDPMARIQEEEKQRGLH
ncbi:ATP-dependent helicase [Secundilactobacillus kimchicus]|uniref:PD-(D/E)XK nuclease family protein n=1 Tax=Secundilactobacillus kimchicus TaxID=528209 RepID=UPI001C02A128|nr:PD-(D/E)XK nuclease family protein [Secundilactobacillus kimchicus]MBT9671332.1 ATP-dependent helicase [Secundilactobacillus kimchicus]